MQLQHRMQMVQKMQQQGMMGNQQPMPHQAPQPGMMGQQPGAMVGQPPQGMMGNPLLAQQQQQQAAMHQGMMGNQQAQQGMMGDQGVAQPQQSLVAGQPMAQAQGMMGSQQGMMGNQQMLQQQQRQQALMGVHQGAAGAQQQALRGPQAQLTPQQQSVLAQRMLLSQQQLQQPPGFLPGPQPGDPPMAPEAPARDGTQMPGVPEGLQQQTGVSGFPQDVPNPGLKEGRVLSPTTPPQQPGPVGDQQGAQTFMNQQQQQQLSELQPQHGYLGNQTLPLQNSMGGEKVMVKQEGQQMCYVAQQQQRQQQQQQQQGAMAGQQQDSMAQLQSMMGQAGPAPAQLSAMVHPNQQQQQQALLAQQQKQGMLGQMGGVMRAQQQGMMGQRPGTPVGPFRGPVNLQAIIAQNPQLRHLPPNQQIQHIQAMLAQRQLQQGQMLRMSTGQGQVRPQGPRMQGPEGQQLHHGAPGPPQQQGMMGQPSGMGPQSQQGMMVQAPGQPRQVGQQGVFPQYDLAVAQQQQMARAQPGLAPGQVRVTPQGRMIRPMSPRQAFGQTSPGDPAFAQQPLQQRHGLAHPGGAHQPSPTQSQPHTPAGSSPFQASHTPVGPRRTGAAGLLRLLRALPSRHPEEGAGRQPLLEGRPGDAHSVHCVPLQKRSPCRTSSRSRGRSSAGAGTSAAGRRQARGRGAPHGPPPETGQQLLQKLLRTKNLQLAAQRPSDGVHSEINGHINSKLALLEQKLQGTPRNMEDLQSITKKPPVVKAKRAPKVGGGVSNSRKKGKKEEPGKSTEALMKQLKQELALLPLMEPSITASLDLFTPFGSSPADSEAQLKGSFGNAVLDNIPDYYSQLLTKSNLSNPPTPPSSLPPTPPPSVQHKLLNGLTAVEELPEGQKERERESAEEPMESSAEEVKSVDLLAALPTPPHNQNEDIRMESDEDSDAPDSIVPASSPESVLGDEAPRFPLLGVVKQEQDERAISPVIPIIPCSSIPVFPESKPFEGLSSFPEHSGKMASRSSPWDKAKSSEVSVTFTLSAAAAKNLNTVMVAVAQLLQVRMPGSYEVTFPPSPGRGGGAEPGKAPDTATPGTLCLKAGPAEGSDQDSADWLKKFDVSLPGCTLKKQVDILSLIKQECPEPEDRAVQHCYITNVSDLDVRQLPIYPVEASPPQSPSPPLRPPTSSAASSARSASSSAPNSGRLPTPAPPALRPSKSKPNRSQNLGSPLLLPLCPPLPPLLPRRGLCPRPQPPSPAPGGPAQALQAAQPAPVGGRGGGAAQAQAVEGAALEAAAAGAEPPAGGSRRESGREVSELMERLRITLRPDRLPRDRRKCCFCHEEGDGATDGPARLLNIDVDLWVHLNCALWSTERTGATNSCNRLRCPNVYHFACAVRARCMFFKDKTMLCTQHKLKGPSEDELSSFAVFRRVYIERDEVKQIASILQRGDRVHLFRVGGLIFHAVGQLLPSQMAAFHSATAIFPVGYEATRIYWSARVPNRRCRYRCRVSEAEGRPLFEVRVLEPGQEDLQYRDATPDGIWSRVVEQVAKLREEAAMLKLFTDHVKGEEMYGLTLHAVLRITESLPGVENCQNYTFRYGRHPLMELPLMINPTGCARSEPKVLTHCKRPHTLNSTSMSKAYQSTFTGETNTPYSKQFVHSKSSQYRRLKTEWKNNVYLARSRIQGLGLYAAKDLEKHTMVIEYIGTIIRNEVANRREKGYEEQNRGIYMFRINNEHVIDATLTAARPEVVTFDKEDKIIIISSRRIPKGEELTYDYQFDFEDDQHKIPCHCGAWNCRKWMN
ncbi:hypothetical protein ANANG_G00221310 [Anguilla anguilla]|uniref:[histone H3]-lysine(4) N-methyltransferase n=1 Tax=Anguilla anguilla TaxID=7936 RepID=A0A9D3LW96_ANGAN|nr:hypothetical protein ANANG_G00221310 [Anguilla anguilla]